MQGLGRHILVDLYGCPAETLNDVALVERALIGAAREANATLINSTVHHFAPFGVSGVLVIQESHLSIHTWPEYGFAAADIFTCGDSIDPRAAWRSMQELLGAQSADAREIERGNPARLQGVPGGESLTKSPPPALPQHTRNVWFTERENDVALSLRHKGDPLWRERSPYQMVEIYASSAYGKFLALDGHIMFSEQDESAYHEMLAHIPVCSHPAIRRAAIIGGGDGGALREVLKHAQVEHIDVVEIDECVVRAVQRHFPANARALSHPRCTLHIADGVAFVQACAAESYDLVILDTGDPRADTAAGKPADFPEQLRRILRPEGLLMARSASPRCNTSWFRQSFAELRAAFGRERVHCCLVPVPTYPSGIWSLAWCGKGSGHPLRDFDRARAAGLLQRHALQYYNPDVHMAAFALPNYVTALLDS